MTPKQFFLSLRIIISTTLFFVLMSFFILLTSSEPEWKLFNNYNKNNIQYDKETKVYQHLKFSHETETVPKLERLFSDNEMSLSCGSCAILSASGAIIGSGLGKVIDQDFDCVFRINKSPTVGFEEDVGSQLDGITTEAFTNYRKNQCAN